MKKMIDEKPIDLHLRRVIQNNYSGGGLSRWDSQEKSYDPEYSSRLYANLKESNLFPENKDGFVFLSVSANKGSKEAELASLIDQEVEGEQFAKKPTIIAADFAGQGTAEFTPIGKESEIPKLKNTEFSHVSADAFHLPFGDQSADIVFDRLGAFWHSSDEDRKLKKLFSEFCRVLKDGGKIIVDAHEKPVQPIKSGNYADPIPSTHARLNESRFLYFNEDFLRESKLEYSMVGEGQDRLLVFTKIKEEAKTAG